MNTVVTARGFELSSVDREYVERKVEKLVRYFDGIQKLEVVLGPEGQRMRAEAILSIVRGETIVCHVDHDQLRAAVDLVVDKAENAVTRHKERLRGHRGSTPEPTGRMDRSGDDLDSYQDVVDRTEFPQ
ncbi:MAG: ribosome-associated translation inhibitor RaiA [Planctomycetota bacterium]